MSGEFLRGVLAENMKTARYKTYSVTTDLLSVVGSQTTKLQKIETATSFLMMQINILFVDAIYTPYKISNQKFQVKKASSGESYSIVPQIYSAYTPCINQTYALPEYPLFDENDYIVLDWFCQQGVSVSGARMIGIFSGIEYRKV